MKMILKVLVVIIAVISLMAVIALFTKNKYSLKRDIVINRSASQVFDFIRYNKNQKSYSKWLSLDPQTKIEIRGRADGSPGSVLAFKSKDPKAGTGEMEITKVVEGERVDFELRFIEPFKFVANGHMETESLSPIQTKVTWVYNGGMNWPMNFMLLFFDAEKVIGSDLQESLGNLKRFLETP